MAHQITYRTETAAINFSSIAPFLGNPLVLVGFTLLVVFGLFKGFLKAGIIPPLPQTTGGRIAMRLLTYAFVIALVTIILGFMIAAYQAHNQAKAAVHTISDDIQQLRTKVSKISWYRLWEEDTRRMCEGTIVQANEINALATEYETASKSGDFTKSHSAYERLNYVLHGDTAPLRRFRGIDSKPESLQDIFNNIVKCCQELRSISNQLRSDRSLRTEDELILKQIEGETIPYETMFEFIHSVLFDGDTMETLRLSKLVEQEFPAKPGLNQIREFRNAEMIILKQLDKLSEIVKRYQ